MVVLSLGFAAMAPVFAFVIAPLRRKYLYADSTLLPLSYPCKFDLLFETRAAKSLTSA